MIQAHIAWLRDDGRALDGLSLPAHEQEEMQRFKHDSRQRSFLLSRLLLRQTLSTLLPDQPLHFSRAESGRLMLTGDSGWHISLSHADAGIAVIAAQRPCGIDIEVSRNVVMEKIAARYFSPQENTALLATPDAERPDHFFRLWTLKEASVKALGEGLAENLARLAFDVSNMPPQLLNTNPALQLWQIQAAPHFIAAAVSGHETVDWHSRQLSIPDLAPA